MLGRPKDPRLKRAIADAARRVVETLGADAVTIRAVALEAKKTSKAPYAHYPGGQPELLAAVAIEGFEELIAALQRRPLPAEPIERMTECVRRYVRFGVEHPNLYRAMFSARLAEPLASVGKGKSAQPGDATFIALLELKAVAYAALIEPLGALHAAGALRDQRRSHEHSGRAAAAMAHGLVGLFIDEGLAHAGRSKRNEPPWSERRRTMTSEATDMLLRGLLLSGGNGREARTSVRHT